MSRRGHGDRGFTLTGPAARNKVRGFRHLRQIRPVPPRPRDRPPPPPARPATVAAQIAGQTSPRWNNSSKSATGSGPSPGKIERGVTKLFGSSNERRVRQLGFVRGKDGTTTVMPGSIIDRINKLEPELEKLSDEQLKNTAADFRARIAKGKTLDDLLPEAFARVRESSKRVAKMRHYDVQMVGGAILHQGIIAEMTTGEGKTLVSSCPAFLNALVGHVHVITVNDYLAKRDMEWIGPIHTALGLTVGAIQANMPAAGAAEGVRLRHHLRDQQRVRVRLSPGQHEAPAGTAGAGSAGLRHRRRDR